MTRQELRVLLDKWFCGCGMPEAAAKALLRLLQLHPLYEHQAEIHEMLPDDGVRHLLFYQLDALDLTEHGGSVGGAWLTDKGKEVRAALEAEASTAFEALGESWCVHGYDIYDESHDCMAAE
jgi:hypothetical protein